MNLINDEISRLDIEKKLNTNLFFDSPENLSIEWGMNYITFSQSKRIRPLLLLESNLIFSDIDEDSYVLASAVELIHTYSLVHDDLPCMDDDELRRGKKTLHVIKNEAYGLLVGDALLTKVFGVLSGYSKKEKLNGVLRYIHEKAGEKGMIYGQVLDMEAENKKIGIENILKLNHNKTGKLLELCLILGAINGNAENRFLDMLEELGCYIGHIFQLQDDILDIAGDKELMGKKTGSDETNNKSSIPLLIGIEKTRQIIEKFRVDALKLIDRLPSNGAFFRGLLEFLINREK
jgi:geranylgeranyl diphosphate synthase, type II